MRYEHGASVMACFFAFLCLCSNLYGVAEPNRPEMQLAKEKMQELQEVYKEVQQAETRLQQLIEQAEHREPLLRPSNDALKKMKAFLEAQDHQRFQEYLDRSTDRTAAYRLYEDCKVIFSQNKFSELLSDPNQEVLLRQPMIYYFRHKAPPDLRASVGLELDPNDPNHPGDEQLWANIKASYLRQAPEGYLEQKREYYVKDRGVPKWLPDYAGNMGFADGMIGWYESGILLSTPQDVRDAEKSLNDLYARMSRIYPRWGQMRHLLAGEDRPDNPAVIDAVREHMATSPTLHAK